MRDGIIEDTPVAECATGCTVPRAHVALCVEPCMDDCSRRCRDHCRGCVPRRAFGDLAVCKACRSRVVEAIDLIPSLVTWITTQDAPSSGAASSSGDKIKRTKKAPPLPFSVAAVDAADALHAVLATWCQVIVDERPGHLVGPDLRGSVHSRKVLADNTGDVIGLGVTHVPRHAVGRSSTSERVLEKEDGDIPGYVRVQVTNWRDRLDDKGGWGDPEFVIEAAPTQRAADWLSVHLDWALAQPFAADLVREITDATWTARRRFPVDAEPKVADAQCFECGNQLICHSGDEGYSPDYICGGCGQRYNEEQYKQALLYLRTREQAAMEVRITAGKSDANDDLAFVSVEDAASWTGRKAWTIRTWMEQDVVRKRKVGAKVQVNLFDVTREHNTRGTRARTCTDGA